MIWTKQAFPTSTRPGATPISTRYGKTFITNLARAGVSPKAAQLLARHSDINLTMNTYTMLGIMDQAAAVEELPAVPGQDARHRAIA